DHAHSLAMAVALESEGSTADHQSLQLALGEAQGDSGTSLSKVESRDTLAFIEQLVGALAELQRQRLNGIWAFVLRNSYRPGLVIGQFNGLISNPPWLALSKFADNPYR